MKPGETQQSYEMGGFRVDAVQRVLAAADGSRVALPSRAFDLLLFFLRHPGELHDKDRLMAAVWPDTVVEENNLTQSIGALRRALGEAPGDHRFLVTVPGRGYKFVAPVRVIAGGEPAGAASDPTPPRRWPVFVAFATIVIVAVSVLWPRLSRPADRSIAVLPFENRSAERENGYLALGVQDEILTLLTRVSELRVVSRNATLRYAGSTAAGPQIGRELGVAYLLEGSVQRSGDLVRVNVALIDATDDRHVWGESYERRVQEVFALESDVAQSVAAALSARLTPQEKRDITSPPTSNPDAYDHYLRARAAAERTTRTESDIRAAIAAYAEAVRIDPTFAVAWAQLSRRHANFFSLAYDRSDERRSLARAALAQALRLAPDSFDTLAARGYFQFVVEGDLAGAESTFRALEARFPQNANVAAGLSQVARELGQDERSRDYARRVLALDAMNPYTHSIICLDQLNAREFALAQQTCERALALLPGDDGILAIEATLFQARGELDRSHELLKSLRPAPDDWRSLRALSRQSLLERKPRDVIELLSRHLATPEALGTRRGFVRRWLGDAQRLAGDAAAARATYSQAAIEIETELERQSANPVLLAELATIRGRLGLLEAAVRLVPRCIELAEHPRRQALVAECAAARIPAELAGGDPARAVAAIAEAASARGLSPPLTPELLRLDPDYDSLRRRSDFAAVVTAAGRAMAESAPK